MPKSIIKGRDENHQIDNISIENVVINGVKVNKDNFHRYFITNDYITGLIVK